MLSTRRHLQDWNDSHQRHRVETSRISRGHILSHAVRPGRDPLPAEFEIEAQRVLDLGNQDGCHDRSLEARRVNVNGNIVIVHVSDADILYQDIHIHTTFTTERSLAGSAAFHRGVDNVVSALQQLMFVDAEAL